MKWKGGVQKRWVERGVSREEVGEVEGWSVNEVGGARGVEERGRWSGSIDLNRGG